MWFPAVPSGQNILSGNRAYGRLYPGADLKASLDLHSDRPPEDRNAELAVHPTVKPAKLVADAILDCSKRGGIVLDPFAGSGTTLIAAEKTDQRGYGIELDPRNCDVIVRRLAAAVKAEATHAATGRLFAEIEQERTAESTVAA